MVDRYHSWVGELFPSLAACIAPSDVMKVSPQGGGFLVRSRLIPLSPVSKVHVVLSNRELPSISGRQLRATAIAHIVSMSY